MGFCRWRALRFGNQSHPDERAFLPLAFLHSKGTQFESHRTGQDPNWCWLCFTLGLFTSTSNRVSAPFTEQSNSVPSPKMCCTKTVAGYLSLPISSAALQQVKSGARRGVDPVTCERAPEVGCDRKNKANYAQRRPFITGCYNNSRREAD